MFGYYREFYQEDDKPQPLHEKTMFLQGIIYKYVLKTADEDKKKIDLTTAKFFYASNISFNVAENDAFHNVIHILKPSYKLPSCKELAGSPLDPVHTEIEDSLKENLKGRKKNTHH